MHDELWLSYEDLGALAVNVSMHYAPKCSWYSVMHVIREWRHRGSWCQDPVMFTWLPSPPGHRYTCAHVAGGWSQAGGGSVIYGASDLSLANSTSWYRVVFGLQNEKRAIVSCASRQHPWGINMMITYTCIGCSKLPNPDFTTVKKNHHIQCTHTAKSLFRFIASCQTHTSLPRAMLGRVRTTKHSVLTEESELASVKVASGNIMRINGSPIVPLLSIQAFSCQNTIHHVKTSKK